MQLCPEGKQLIDHALTKKGWTLEKLANESDYSISTIKKFSSGMNIGRITFVVICTLLEVDWEIASGIKSPSFSSKDEIYSDNQTTNLYDQTNYKETQIENIRKQYIQKIINQYSRIRLLDGREVKINRLYVDVYLLNKPEKNHYHHFNSILNSFDIEKDRLAMSKRITRVRGLDIVNEKKRVVVLGKPGSGKTTFLKHLAFDWCNKKFQPQLISVFIELRKVKKINDKSWNLLDTISSELNLNNFSDTLLIKKQIISFREKINNITLDDSNDSEFEKNVKKEKAIQITKDIKYLEDKLPIHKLLKDGNFLVLIDGLDEVSTKQSRVKVQEQLNQIVNDYPKCRFIISCRTQVVNYILDDFTYVEVADFSPVQIEAFVKNWFDTDNSSFNTIKSRWQHIKNALFQKAEIRELTATPVLLSLLCLIIGDEGKIPSDKLWLYKKGINLLLNKWNNQKGIQEWELGTSIYRRLNTQEKELLLMEIAGRKFDNKNNNNYILFGQQELATQIAQHLKLANYSDGKYVLEAIESQHGLLIERADDLWSFSHLTFQEYFTVQWLTQLSSEELAKRIANQQWQEYIQEIIKSQQPVDDLLKSIKYSVEKTISQKPGVQLLLKWLFKKSESFSLNRKNNIEAIRTRYYKDFISTLSNDSRTIAHSLAFSLVRDIGFECSLNPTINMLDIFSRITDMDRANALKSIFEKKFTVNDVLNERDCDLTFTIDYSLKLATALAYELDYSFGKQIEDLHKDFPSRTDDCKSDMWWTDYSPNWIGQLRQIMVKNCNIGYDWEHSDNLVQYFNANKFIYDLMNVNGAVRYDTCAEIEESLLLPWNELQYRYPHIYIK